MKKILVPTEFTYLSKCALELGMQVANQAQAAVEVVTVIKAGPGEIAAHLKDNGAPSRDAGLSPQLTQVAQAKAQKHADEVKAWFPGLEVTPKILYGDPVNVLLDTIDTRRIELVIIGGDRYQSEDVAADKFLRNAGCPVLTVKCRLDNLERYKDIIFLVDLEKDSAGLITHLVALQELLGAKVHLLYVSTPGDPRSQAGAHAALEEHARRYPIGSIELVVHEAENERDGLLTYSQAFDQAIIAMAVHDRSFLEWLLSYNPTGKIIADSIHPVWTFKG